MTTITDKLGVVLSVGDKVAYQSFKSGGMEYGVVTELKRTRAVVSSITVERAGITNLRPSGVVEPVSSYDLIRV